MRDGEILHCEDGSEHHLEIAAGCGFASGSAFARAFRARFGINPSDFRQGSLEQHRKAAKRR